VTSHPDVVARLTTEWIDRGIGTGTSIRLGT
jgi:hypothetical protein